MKLGRLIRELDAMPHDALCEFDTGGYPGSANTYRGYYQDLALSRYEYPVTVAQVLETLNNVNGNMLEGYKGGEYVMHDDVTVYVAEWGSCSGVVTSRVQLLIDGKVIITTHEED